MERFVKGDVVVIPFPFSDLSQNKRRPALVLVDLVGNDLILCQITSKQTKDAYSIEITKDDFENGYLTTESNVRPNKLFTADRSIILYRAGTLKETKAKQIIDAVVDIFQK